jgi:Spy/CpxP family protein refolding chaperone
VHASSDDGDDDDNDVPSVPDVDDDRDVDQAVQDLGDLSLNPDQRAKISALRADSDAKVASAKHALDAASEKLQKLLSSGGSEAEVSSAIDAVTTQENAIRKARLLAWVRARSFLDASQRAKVEKAAAKKSH